MSLSHRAQKLTETALFRLAYGERHTAKRIARDHGVAPATAKGWLAGRIPAVRLEAIVEALRSQLHDRLDELAAAESELTRIAELRPGRRRR